MAPQLHDKSINRRLDAALRALHASGRPEWAGDLSATHVDGNLNRIDYAERLTFLVSTKQAPLAHLTIGSQLNTLWAKTSAFADALSNLAARPLFFAKLDDVEILVREFVLGKTFHDLADSGELSPENASTRAYSALQLLEGTTEVSTIEAARLEAAAIFRTLESLPIFQPIDRLFISEVIAPFVMRCIDTSSSQTRWTNGDFTPRNLILEQNGGTRLIDYEFAQRTHFPDDAWRWDNLGATGNAPRLSKPGQYPAWLEILFWCRQLVLSYQTTPATIAKADATPAIKNILTLLGSEPSVAFPQGLFSAYFVLSAPLNEEVARLSSSEILLRDRIARIQASRSWRYTAGFRAIRRIFSSVFGK